MNKEIGQVKCAHCGNIFTKFVGVKSALNSNLVLLFKCENEHPGFTELVITQHEGESRLSTRKAV